MKQTSNTHGVKWQPQLPDTITDIVLYFMVPREETNWNTMEIVLILHNFLC